MVGALAAAIPLVFSVIEQGAALYQKLRAAAAQSGEMTEDELKAMDARMAGLFQTDAYKTDAELEAEGRPRP